MKHLLILEVLRKYSSEESPMLQQDIIDKLQSDYGYNIERKAVGSALSDLTKYYDIEKVNNKGWYIDDELFLPPELRYLIDSVLFSKNVPANYADSIIKKLQGLGKDGFSRTIGNVVKSSSLKRTEEKNIFLNVEDIARAISEDRQISFEYNEYRVDKKLHPVFEEKVVLNPYTLYAKNDRYYVIGKYRGEETVASFRLDMITDLDILPDPREKKDGRLDFDIGEYLSTHPYSYVGKPERIAFWIENFAINEVIDAFNDFKVSETNEERSLLIVEANLADSEDWFKRFGKYSEVVYPQKLRDKLRDYSVDIDKKYSAKEADRYAKAVSRAARMQERGIPVFLDLTNMDLSKRTEHKKINGASSVTLINNNLTEVDFLKDFTKLKKLYIADNAIKDLDCLRELKGLKSFTLIGSEVTDLSFLKDFENLQELHLENNKITDFGFIYGLFDLRSLRMDVSSVFSLDLYKLKYCCPHLKIDAPELSNVKALEDRLFFDIDWVTAGDKTSQLFELFVDVPETFSRKVFTKKEAQVVIDYIKDKESFKFWDIHFPFPIAKIQRTEILNWLIKCHRISPADEKGVYRVLIHD